MVFTPMQELFDMPTIFADFYQRQTTFGFHPRGEVVDQARKRWGVDDRFIQTLDEKDSDSAPRKTGRFCDGQEQRGT